MTTRPATAIHRTLVGALVAGALAALVAGCGGGDEPSARAPARTVTPAEVVALGDRMARVRVGMRKERVRSIVGEPEEAAAQSVGGRRVECWTYLKGATLHGVALDRVYRLCFRDGRFVDRQRLIIGRTRNELRFLLGAPDSSTTRRIAGRPARCWRYNFVLGESIICFRGGRAVSEKSFA